MLPSIVARQIHESVREFLKQNFRTTTPFFIHNGASIMERFVNAPENVYKGPWLDIKLPFETTTSVDVPEFRRIRPTYKPYAHQKLAFQRLSTAGDHPQSTIIATGTGSGKTECFSYPMLDHCIDAKMKGERGIKAIIIYPMNALAIDQSRRFARDVHQFCSEQGLLGKNGLRVGRYTGEGASTGDSNLVQFMTPTEVINDRQSLRENPPDILLTNYKMLDYLLMRPQDQPLWMYNKPGVLRYLVVDELHTFDGAQGTDLACLIRRLRARLNAGNELLCVGTSATIGSGEEALENLREYASQVFATPFNNDAIIGERRLSQKEYFAKCAEHEPADLQGRDFEKYPFREIVDLDIANSHQDQLMEQFAEAWFPSANNQEDSSEEVNELPPLPPLRFANVPQDEQLRARIALGHRLRKHHAFQDLLNQCEQLVEIRTLAERWTENHNTTYQRLTLDQAIVVIDSLISLIAYARDAANPLAPPHAPVRAVPMLHVRTQLWMRELRRMVSSVEYAPRLLHVDDVTRQDQGLRLPLVHCRECLAMGWGTVRAASTEPVEQDLRKFYNQWFSRGSDVQLLYPLTQDQSAPTDRKGNERWMCSVCGQLHLTPPQQGCCSVNEQPVPLLRVWIPLLETVDRDDRAVRDEHCPWCHEHGTLSIVGSQAASLASVAIAQLFGSNHTNDRKLITFSDSVQDAAHRAGFFGARTYRQVARLGMRRVIEHSNVQTFEEFLDEVPHYWRSTLGDADFVGTFIAPDMEWINAYQALLDDNKLPPGNFLPDKVEKRLRWDALIEFGLRARIGRSLDRSGIATIALDDKLVRDMAWELMGALREDVIAFRNLSPTIVEGYLRGLFADWRRRGAFDVPEMRTLIRDKGNTFVWSQRNPDTRFYLPNYGLAVAPPTPLVFESVHRRELDNATPLTTTVKNSSLWSDEWFRRTLAYDKALYMEDAQHQIMRAVVHLCLKHGVLNAADDALKPNIFLMNTAKWGFYRETAEVVCNTCQRRQVVPQSQQFAWRDMQCLRAGCTGHYQAVSEPQRAIENATQTIVPNPLHTTTNDDEPASVVPAPTRIIAREHTGLLSSEERKKIEEAFIHAEHVWDVNLLSSTPTLEMGIDIGDLSSVLLCSVPPSQANYLQRIGRAGRRDGNALSMVFANAKAHDNYFYADPVEMMDGKIQTPGVYLKALAVLERQLTAFAFDHWAQNIQDPRAVPTKLETVLDALKKQDAKVFPLPLLQYIENNQEMLLREFLRMFPELGEEGGAHLREFLQGNNRQNSLKERVLKRLDFVRAQRENFLERGKKANTQIGEWDKKPDDELKETALDTLLEERASLQALVKGINNRHTLNFFTDEGLLPNYAFPEEGVTLKSVIVRDKTKHEGQQENKKTQREYEYVDFGFQRSASSALRELAPESRFYAAAHQLTIERVNLKDSPVEEWRLCDQCDYAERVNENEQSEPTCPRCHSELWGDLGQQRTLIRLRTVHAYARAGKDRIDDQHENRHTTFYERQLLVDIPPNSPRKAYQINDPQYPFGFEYLPHVTFREFNFGELSTQGQSFRVAGKEGVRQGFQICKDCGTVRKRNKKQQRHAFDCPVTQNAALDTDAQYFESLYLYRQLESESLRILLPMSETHGSELGKASFVAALQLGLRKHFKGNVQHLEVTTMTSNQNHPEGERDYVLFYDTVPGGTGYLKDLMRNPDNIFQAFARALEALIECPTCAKDDTRDGCYQCILAYRSVYNQRDISRKKAIQLFQELLQKKDQLQEIESVDNIELSGWHDSRLEARIVEALQNIPNLDVVSTFIEGRSAYHIHTYNQELERTLRWDLIPQWEVSRPGENTVATKSDFYLRLASGLPALERQRFRMQIYADGYQYHHDIVDDDVYKRNVVLSTGHRVWTLTWDDLESADGRGAASHASILRARHNVPKGQVADYLLKHRKIFTGREVQDVQQTLRQNDVDLLVAWIQDPQGTETLLQKAAQLELIARADHQSAPTPTALQSKMPSNVCAWLDEQPKLIFGGFDRDDKHEDTPVYDVAQCYTWLDATKLSTPTWIDNAGVALWIDDQKVADSEANKNQWRAYWSACNIMQFAPHIILTAQTKLENQSANSAWTQWPERKIQSTYLEDIMVQQEEGAPPDANSWETVLSEEMDVRIDHDALQILIDAGCEVPEVGMDFPLEGITIGTAELLWKNQKIAVCLPEDYPTSVPPDLDWTIVRTDDPHWTTAVRQKLNLE